MSTSTPSITIFSGNILHNFLKPTISIADSLVNAVQAYTKLHGCIDLASQPDLTIFNDQSHCSLDEDTEVRGKLFVPADVTGDSIKAILDQVHTSIFKVVATPNVKPGPLIEVLSLSIQGLEFSDDDEDADDDEAQCHISPARVFEIWQQFTSYSRKLNLCANFGIAELNTRHLTSLITMINQADHEIIKPIINHVNAIDCCVLPPSLISFAKEENILLLAHHDPNHILSDSQELKTINNAICGLNKSCKTDNFAWSWLIKLTSMVKERQVLVSHEYVGHLTRS
ncbi:hypothetical protein NADFUDRAFT_53025 [Nadsonia fulvescens var. elongata DSM 6958]|uniref:GCS light chain n=1 Tax=Nadsonia fulvescens var. elongata DSM 6958 TaxID=857566 RepID=A0A1E3PFR3_9ASCO|nr:hypothetical protein NADFUDRAFT_53025 [Nadsonia fulvescens var. elongata DSM 6958]